MLANKKTRGIAVLLMCVTVLGTGRGTPVFTDCELAKLLASDGVEGDQFGVSVGIWGDTAVIGADWCDDSIDEPGSAYIFRFNGSSWVEEAILTASDGEGYDGFGWSVDISGDTVIVGAPDDLDGPIDGSAYIFRFDGPTWVEEDKLIAVDEDAFFVWLAFSVGISGDTAVLGAPTADVNGTPAGKAYVFQFDGSSWVQQAILFEPNRTIGDEFGLSVDVSGDTVIAGARNDDDRGTDSGSAYIFAPNDVDPNKWDRVAKLLASDGEAGDNFGQSVSISGHIAVIGADWDDDNGEDSGSAYIFRFNGSSWVEEAKLLASDGAADDGFGFEVSIWGDTAVIGAVSGDGNDTDAGSDYILRFDGSAWVEQVKLVASDGATDDQFSYSVAISGDTAVIGADWDDDNGDNSGSAYIFGTSGTLGDLDFDNDVDFVDYSLFTAHWLQTDCGPCRCDRADFTSNGQVDIYDLKRLCDNWLQVL